MLVKELKKELRVTALLCALSLVVLVLVTIAWFAANNTTAASNADIQASASPNLIIAKTVTELKNMTADATTPYSVSFETPSSILSPSTHNWSIGTTTGLAYNTTPRRVSFSSGNKLGADELVLAPVPVLSSTDEHIYYVDYTVYIGSKDVDLDTARLYATIKPPDSLPSDYMKAASVDFYLGSVSESNYKGTLNLANRSYLNNNDDPVTEVSLIEDGTVPVNTSGGIEVIMRFYYDGNLQKSTEKNQAYIYSSEKLSTEVALGVNFIAE